MEIQAVRRCCFERIFAHEIGITKRFPSSLFRSTIFVCDNGASNSWEQKGTYSFGNRAKSQTLYIWEHASGHYHGPMKKIRLDNLLVERGFFETPDEALRAVLAHEVKVNDAYATSSAQQIAPDADVQVKGQERYVSRGGYKLEGALQAFGQDVEGLRCLDAGSSTGGFTDCLLQAGAANVTCVDVGYGILAWKVRSDPRTVVFERTNIRTASPDELGAPFDLIVADLSFIGLASLAPTFAALCARGSVFIGLVKPQFESRHEETDRGLVRDEGVRIRTVEEVCAALEQAGFAVTGVVESPIRGKAAGNVEYLVRAVMDTSLTV